MLLLTGATGAAGSFIANQFLTHREPVRLLVRSRKRAPEFENVPTVDLVEGDMSDAGTLAAALKDVRRVLMISSSSPDMVDTQCTFIDACRAAGVEHVIKFSGLDARPGTTFAFGRMHKQIEEHLERSGLAWTQLRPTGFMQEYLREVPTIVHDGALYLPLGEVKLNPVDLLDVGRIGYLLLRHGGHESARLTVTGPEALGMAEVASRISQATGRAVRYIPISAQQRREALIAHGIAAPVADALDAQVHERLQGGLESLVDLSTHRLFDVEATTFARFAQRNAQMFAGQQAVSMRHPAGRA